MNRIKLHGCRIWPQSRYDKDSRRDRHLFKVEYPDGHQEQFIRLHEAIDDIKAHHSDYIKH